MPYHCKSHLWHCVCHSLMPSLQPHQSSSGSKASLFLATMPDSTVAPRDGTYSFNRIKPLCEYPHCKATNSFQERYVHHLQSIVFRAPLITLRLFSCLHCWSSLQTTWDPTLLSLHTGFLPHILIGRQMPQQMVNILTTLTQYRGERAYLAACIVFLMTIVPSCPSSITIQIFVKTLYWNSNSTLKNWVLWQVNQVRPKVRTRKG